MTHINMDYAPSCAKSTCFGFFRGRCAVLCDNDFGERTCPFFKTKEQKRQQETVGKERIKLLKLMRKEMCGNGYNGV